MLFDVKNTPLSVPFLKAFTYIRDANKLPIWTNAFAKVNNDGSALMSTPQGEVTIQLDVISDEKLGTVDWKMTFADGSQGIAHSRVIPLSEESCAYSFILTPPPVPLEMLEGALAEQGTILEKELVTLKAILEN